MLGISNSPETTLPERLYRLLLHSYPAEFRQEFGEDMLRLFRDCYRDAYEQNGVIGVLDFGFRTVLDLAESVIREHLEGGYFKMTSQNLQKSASMSLFITLAASLIALSVFVVDDATLLALLQLMAVVAFWNYGLKWLITSGRMQLSLPLNGEEFYAANIFHKLLKVWPRMLAS